MKHLVVGLTILMLMSCNIQGKRINVVHQLYGAQISFPDSMLIVKNGKVSRDKYLHNNSSVVCWLDSNICSPCAVKGLYLWEDLIEIGTSDTMSFDVVFIFMPKYNDKDAILQEILKQPKFKGILLIDDNYSFVSGNLDIYKNIKYFNTYLIDKNDTVKIVGSPIKNDVMWNLYLKHLKMPDL